MTTWLSIAPNLNTFVYTARAWRWSLLLTLGRWPATSPPLSPANFPVEELAGRDVIYIKLHGLPNEPRWYAVDNRGTWQDALDLKTISQAPDLAGAVVFAQSCYAQKSPMVQALLKAGASTIVGTSVKLKAGYYWPAESDWIGKYFLHFLAQGKTVQDAIQLASTQAFINRKTTQRLRLSITGNHRRRFT